MKSRSVPESMCFWTLALTWPLYGIGALYLVGPILAWLLFAMITVVAYFGETAQPNWALAGAIPPVVWIWIASMTLMLLTLWIGHVNWGLDTAQIVNPVLDGQRDGR